MSRTGKDLIVSLAAGAAIVAVFASLDLVEILFEATRVHEDWDLDEIIACIPALAIVATWFALRRWREVAQSNRTLNRQAGELADALAQRHAMEEQLREGYKVAAMGTLGGGFSGALRRVLEPIERLSSEGLETDLVSQERRRLERISEAAQGGLTIVSRMLAFGDGGTRATESIVAANGVLESISLATEGLDTALEVAYRANDEASRIHVNRWELHEVTAQIVANAAEAMGTGGRLQVAVDRTTVDRPSAEARGLAAGNYVRVTVEDDGPGIPAWAPEPCVRALLHDQGNRGRQGPRACHCLQPGPRLERRSVGRVPTGRGRNLRDFDPGRRRGRELKKRVE